MKSSEVITRQLLRDVAMFVMIQCLIWLCLALERMRGSFWIAVSVYGSYIVLIGATNIGAVVVREYLYRRRAERTIIDNDFVNHPIHYHAIAARHAALKVVPNHQMDVLVITMDKRTRRSGLAGDMDWATIRQLCLQVATGASMIMQQDQCEDEEDTGDIVPKVH